MKSSNELNTPFAQNHKTQIYNLLLYTDTIQLTLIEYFWIYLSTWYSYVEAIQLKRNIYTGFVEACSHQNTQYGCHCEASTRNIVMNIIIHLTQNRIGWV